MQLIHFKPAPQRVDFTADFLRDLESAGKSPNTLKGYRIDLEQFQKHLNKPVEDATGADLRAYFATLDGLSLTSRARKQASVSSLYQWMVKVDALDHNPMEKVTRVKLPKYQPRPLDEDTVSRIMGAIPSENLRDRLLFTLLLETGMRISEALKIWISDLSLVSGKEKIINIKGKGGKERNVYLYLYEDALPLLKQYLEETGYTFGPLFRGQEDKGGSNKSLSYRAAHKAWCKYTEKAGLPKREGLHAFRHTFVTALIEDGVDTAIVKELAGHESIQTTLRYGAITERTIQREMSKRARQKEKIE